MQAVLKRTKLTRAKDSVWASLALPWRACLEEAWTAYCAGSIPIGAVVTDQAGRIVSRGRNRIFETSADGRHLYGHRLAHAEMNALNALDYTAVDPTTCVLYTTTEPCPLCTGAIRVVRLRDVRYASRDAAGGSIDLLTANAYMRRGQVRVTGPERDDLEAIIVAMHVVFGLERWTEAWRWVVDAWEASVPCGVALGRALYRSGELHALRADGASVSAIVDTLAARLPVSPS